MFWVNLVLVLAIILILGTVFTVMRTARRRHWENLVQQVGEKATAVDQLLQSVPSHPSLNGVSDRATEMLIQASEALSNARNLSQLAAAEKLLDRAQDTLQKSIRKYEHSTHPSETSTTDSEQTHTRRAG